MSQHIGRTGLTYARQWHHIDIKFDKRPLGIIASNIALTLMGKHKPVYTHEYDCGDNIVVTNCHFIRMTGKKFLHKKYYRQSTMPGQLKTTVANRLKENSGGGELLRLAVYGMLPKNKLRTQRMQRLKLYEGDENPYEQLITKFYTDKIVDLTDPYNLSKKV